MRFSVLHSQTNERGLATMTLLGPLPEGSPEPCLLTIENTPESYEVGAVLEVEIKSAG